MASKVDKRKVTKLKKKDVSVFLITSLAFHQSVKGFSFQLQMLKKYRILLRGTISCVLLRRAKDPLNRYLFNSEFTSSSVVFIFISFQYF